jgi:putative transposase
LYSISHHLHLEVLRRPPESAAYTSLAFSQRVVELEVEQSFGSTGDCYDNAAVESFFATLKRELAWIHATKNWPTRTALRSALFGYIEGFYNPERIQHRLGHQSPTNYEQDSAA